MDWSLSDIRTQPSTLGGGPEQRWAGDAAAARGTVAGPGTQVLVLVFRRNETRLRAIEFDALREWVQACLRDGGRCRVVVGCCPDTARRARLSRWRELCKDLARCGVPRAWIECTGEWSEPAWSAPPNPLPEDAVWLRAIDASADDPTRAGTRDTRLRRSQNTHACTSAS